MDYGTLLLSTLFVMLVAVVGYRVVILYYRRGVRKREDFGQVEEKARLWWRRGAAVVVLVGFCAMVALLLLSGVSLISPLPDAITLGIVYAMMGMGLTLTYSVVKIPNFAHGEMATIGAYTMTLSNAWFGVPIWLAFIAGAGTGAILGWLQHMIVFRPLLNRKAKIVQIMIASFALSLIIRAIFWMFAAYENVTHPKFQTFSALTSISIPFTSITLYNCNGICRLGDGAFTDLLLALVFVAIPLVISMHLLLTRTLIGKSMRAVADNIELAQVTGIDVEYIRQITWILTGALTGLGGAFLAILYTTTPELGWNAVLRVFAAVTLGGLVSFYGTIAGGLIVGFGEIWVTDITANFAPNFASSFQPAIAFLIIALVLLIRPGGLSGLKLPRLRLRRQPPAPTSRNPAETLGSG